MLHSDFLIEFLLFFSFLKAFLEQVFNALNCGFSGRAKDEVPACVIRLTGQMANDLLCCGGLVLLLHSLWQ